MDKKFYIFSRIIKYIKKHKLYFCGGLIAAAVLTATFFAGGSLSNETKPLSAAPVLSSSTDETLSNSENSNSVNESSEQDKTSANIKKNASSSNSDANTTATQKQNSGSDKKDNNTQNSNSINDNSASPYSKEYYHQNSSSSNLNNNQSSASSSNKDKYNTDPVPSGKPKPVEPQDKEITDNQLTCTISINCATILDNLDKFNPEKIELVPEDGWILKPTKVTFNEGESTYDLLVRVCKENKIHMSARWTPLYNSHYIESINNIKEFDCPTDRFHNTSGWMCCVNGWYSNYGVSRYELKAGDVVEINYSCIGLGADLGAKYATGG